MSDFTIDQVQNSYVQAETARLTTEDRAEVMVGYGAIAVLLGLTAEEFLQDLHYFANQDPSFKPLVTKVSLVISG